MGCVEGEFGHHCVEFFFEIGEFEVGLLGWGGD